MSPMVPDRASHPNRKFDEWGGPISAAKIDADKQRASRRASDKAASEAAGAKFAKIDAYKASPEGKAAQAHRDRTEFANQGSHSVEGQTGSGGYSKSVGNRPIRRQE